MRPNLFISRVLSLLLITLSGLSLEVRAQERVFDYEKGKATDYFKFNDDGTLCAAKKTFDNGAVFEMTYYKKKSEGKTKVALYYESGDEIDFTRSLWEKPNQLDILVCRPADHFSPSGMDPMNINEWFKTKVMPCTSAPNPAEMKIFNVKAETRVLVADNGTVFEFPDIYDVIERLPNGNYIKISNLSDYNTIEDLKISSADYTVNYFLRQPEKSTIVYNDGKVFKGSVKADVKNDTKEFQPGKFKGVFATRDQLSQIDAVENDYAWVIFKVEEAAESVSGWITTCQLLVRVKGKNVPWATLETKKIESKIDPSSPYEDKSIEWWESLCEKRIQLYNIGRRNSIAKSSIKYEELGLNKFRKLVMDSTLSKAMGSKISRFIEQYELDHANILLIEDLAGVDPYHGVMVDSKGNVIDIYRNGQKLDEFDKMQVIAEEQGKIKKEQERAQNAIAQKQELIKKYGEKYTNALYAGKIITGMPEELFLLGLAINQFNNVFTATISIQNGEDRCYDLYQFDQNTFSMKQLGFVWVIDKKVSSIVYY